MTAPEETATSPGLYYLVAWLIPALFAAFHVVRDCRKLAEPTFFHVTGTFILWPLYYLGWILWWPGALRLWFQGKRVDDLPQAQQLRRLQDRKPLRHRRS